MKFRDNMRERVARVDAALVAVPETRERIGAACLAVEIAAWAVAIAAVILAAVALAGPR